MLDQELAATFEEDLPLDCTPPQTLQALSQLQARAAKYQADEPGDYQIVGPDARWSTENLRSRWRMSLSLWRVRKETDDAEQNSETTSLHGSDRP